MDAPELVEEREGGWYARLEGERGGGGLPLNSTSLALETTRIVKAGAGTLYGFTVLNDNAAQRFLHIFDTQALLANGAVPVLVFPVPTVSALAVDFGYYGRAFEQGIMAATSTSLATLTLGSADMWFDFQYV